MINMDRRNNLRCCANCQHWEYFSSRIGKLTEVDEDEIHDISVGSCHRYPPNVPCMRSGFDDTAKLNDLCIETMRGMLLVDHPWTFAEDWCGEFAMADELAFTQA